MTFQLFSQRDPQWQSDILLGGPDTIGSAGCLLTVNAMIAWDAFSDTHYTPKTLNALFQSRHDYEDGDLLTDQALSFVWPDRFSEQRLNGYDDARVQAAVNAPDQYCYLGLAGPGTHFVIAAGPNLLADPWTGSYSNLSGYFKTGWSVVDMVFVTKHVPIPPPPLPQPHPLPTPPSFMVIRFLTGTDDHPADQVTTLADAEKQADDWLNTHPGGHIEVWDGEGHLLYTNGEA